MKVQSTRGPRARIAVGMYSLCVAAALAGSAKATQGIAYRWQSPRVQVTWTEGNSSPMDPALLRQVGHWKRTAESLWAAAPRAPALEMSVSFHDAQMGSSGPEVKLRAGGRATRVEAPLTEARVAEALYRIRDGAAATLGAKLPADDAEGRVSSTGESIASISWRGGGPEIWLLPPAPKRAFRIPFPDPGGTTDPLILTEPRWAPQGRRLGWVQGGRLVLLDGRGQQAQIVTPRERTVVDFQWSPFANLLLVRFDDDSFQILDLRRSRAMALSELAPDAIPMGEFFWAPSSRKLVFRTQSRVVTADLSPARAAVNAVDRFLNRLVGTPEPPTPLNGANEERLAVLDLGLQRLDTYPVANTPLQGATLTSALWSPNEDLLYGVAESPEGTRRLIRFPLGSAQKPGAILETPDTLVALQRLGTSADPRFVFLNGAQRLTFNATGTLEPAPEEPLTSFKLAPGPLGGYRGVEGEEITEDEAPRHLRIETLTGADTTGLRQRYESGLWASTTRDSGLIDAVRKEITSDVVDADLFSVLGKEVAVVMRSPSGGAAELWSVSTTPGDPAHPTTESVSRRLSEAKELINLPLLDEPFKVVEPRSGMGDLAVHYQTLSGRRMLIAMLATLLLISAVVYARSRRRARA